MYIKGYNFYLNFMFYYNRYFKLQVLYDTDGVCQERPR